MGAELWVDAVKNGKISEDEYAVPADSKRGLGNLTLEEINEYQKKAFKQFYLRPRYLIAQLYRALLERDINRIRTTLKIASSSQLRNIL
jgi:hypothetical protein